MKIEREHLEKFLAVTENRSEPEIIAARTLVSREIRRRDNAGRPVTKQSEEAKKNREYVRRHRELRYGGTD